MSIYDSFASLYHRHWANWYLPAALPVLEKLFFSRIPPQAQILDVCCGSGHVTRELARRNYRVTGVDVSEGLLSIAKNELPQVDWQKQDVRSMHLSQTYDAALSTFDSLNHILTIEDLEDVFRNVRRALKPEGLFVFDMNSREAFLTDMRSWSAEVGDGNVSLVRGFFDDEKQIASTEIVWFRREGENWLRSDSVVKEKCYPQTEILKALDNAGFESSTWVGGPEAGMKKGLGHGRIFFIALA